MSKPGNVKVKEGKYETSADCPRFISLQNGQVICRHPDTGKNVRMDLDQAQEFVNTYEAGLVKDRMIADLTKIVKMRTKSEDIEYLSLVSKELEETVLTALFPRS